MPDEYDFLTDMHDMSRWGTLENEERWFKDSLDRKWRVIAHQSLPIPNGTKLIEDMMLADGVDKPYYNKLLMVQSVTSQTARCVYSYDDRLIGIVTICPL